MEEFDDCNVDEKGSLERRTEEVELSPPRRMEASFGCVVGVLANDDGPASGSMRCRWQARRRPEDEDGALHRASERAVAVARSIRGIVAS